ncbi:MAG: aliphatic sulfonate ABC transporter substrate-binding protein [Chroococcidiopsidaceae cyanobacterium CP_BM_ER_R8_30]|nr:aliphatic sulfonate ABC transporter substrate-binding protein [Chroococcidiopsidaceae cyanobacterium CP_BM_ER_R8_30]
MAIRIGVHPNNLSLFTLSKKPEFLQELLEPIGQSVEWVHYLDGTKTIIKLGEREIDFGGTGSTPPIKAQAIGISIVYVATSQPRPAHGAIVVPQHSSIQRVAELKGKTVTLIEGSFLQHLLVVVLDREGLTYDDVNRLHLSPREALNAFASGEVDAWVVGDPFLAELQKTQEFRILTYTADVISDRSVYFTHGTFADEHLDLVQLIVKALERTDRWIATHFLEAAELLATEIDNGLDAATWKVSLRRRPWGLVPVAQEFVAEQQHAADLFYRFGIFPNQIEVSQAVLPDPVSVFDEVNAAPSGSQRFEFVDADLFLAKS